MLLDILLFHVALRLEAVDLCFAVLTLHSIPLKNDERTKWEFSKKKKKNRTENEDRKNWVFSKKRKTSRRDFYMLYQYDCHSNAGVA